MGGRRAARRSRQHATAGNIIGPGPEAERWQRHQIDLIHSAEQYGCSMILSHAGSRFLNRDTAHPQNWSRESWNMTVNALKRICKDTAGVKIDIAIEPVNTEFLNNPWAMKRLQDDVGDERLRCGLDITNMVHPQVAFRMSEFTNTTFDLLEDSIRYLHAKDFAWNSMATTPEAMLAMSEGIVKGETREGPRSMRTRAWFSMVSMPPMPEPMITPKRSESSLVTSTPASWIARREAATAYCV